jgi:hypothetical protein
MLYTNYMIKFNTTIFKRFSFAALAVFMSCVTMLGLSGKAFAAPPNLYFTQNNLMVNGSSLYVQVHANSVNTPVNAVQADFTYPTGLLTFVSIDSASSAFDITASQTGGSGSVSIQRGATAPKTGDLYIATVKFTVVGTGTANLNFQNSSLLLRSSNNTDILNEKLNATITGIAGPLVPVFRLFNTINNDRLLTTDAWEVHVLTTSVAGWRSENTAFYTVPSGTAGAVPVFRLFNTINNDRLLTTDAWEVHVLTTSVAGWRSENTAFYTLPAGTPGSMPVFRLFNTINNDRLLTTDAWEVHVLTTSVAGWRSENTAFYTPVP